MKQRLADLKRNVEGESYLLYSPDKRFKLTFFDSIEPKMGMNMSKFSLTDLQTNKVINYEKIMAVGYSGYSTSWSEDSNYFVLPVCSPSNCFFIYNILRKQFTSIAFDNVWILSAHCNEDWIEIEFEDSQIPERQEHNKYPTKNYVKPLNLIFKLSELQWASIDQLQGFSELSKNSVVYDLKPIDKGWREFKGQLPGTTEILISELKEFAKYGDYQSMEWLNEIATQTNDINNWVNASHYLGYRRRKT